MGFPSIGDSRHFALVAISDAQGSGLYDDKTYFPLHFCFITAGISEGSGCGIGAIRRDIIMIRQGASANGDGPLCT